MNSVIINPSSSRGPVADNEIRLDMNSSISLDSKELSLNYLGLYYSHRNITSDFQNNKFSYRWVDNSEYQVLVEDGFYSINDLSAYM